MADGRRAPALADIKTMLWLLGFSQGSLLETIPGSCTANAMACGNNMFGSSDSRVLDAGALATLFNLHVGDRLAILSNDQGRVEHN